VESATLAVAGWLQTLLGRLLHPSAGPDSGTASFTVADAPDPGSPVVPTDPPYDGVVYIVDEIGNEYYQGSGILIAPDEVLTASHVVYTEGIGVATNVEVYDGYDGDFGSEYSIGTVTHYNAIDDAGGKISLEDSQQDYAIIHLSTPFTGSTVFSLMADYPGGTVTTSGYPANADGAQIAYTGDVTPYEGISVFYGAALGPGSSGGPVWLDNTDGEPTAVGLVSSYDTTSQDAETDGNDVQLTNTALTQIETWVTQDDGTTPALTVLDTSTDAEIYPQLDSYSGLVAGLTGEYINVSTDNLNVTAGTNSVFIHTGSGEDAIAVQGGANVLDGGTGSNFLVGGSGTDTFFTDDRAATASIWDTLVNFHQGDAATIFGVTQSGFTFDWENGQGAAGYTGLTLHASEADNPVIASVTLAGFNSADLTNGVLAISYGTTDGSPYMYIYDKG
jgi:V8-like Glu-specific endopeptidase